MRTDRAVSEVLGYVLVISLVTVMIATVMTLGVSGLYDSQSAEQTANMERAFDVMADNFKQMYAGEAPSRATEMRMVEGHIRYGDPVFVDVEVDGERLGNMTIQSNPIVYDNDQGTVISYEAGAVVRDDRGEHVMLNEPSFYLDTEEMLIIGIRTRPLSGSTDRINSPRTVLIRGDGLRQSSANNVAQETTNITVISDRSGAWEAFFEQQNIENAEIHRNGNEVTLSHEPEETTEVTIVERRIRTSFSN